MFRVEGSGFQPWGCLHAFCGSRELLVNFFINYFYILHFVHGTTFCLTKTMGLPSSSAVNNFVLEGLTSVIDDLRPPVT